MIKPVSGTRCLRRHITAVVGIDRRLERHPAGNFNAGLFYVTALLVISMALILIVGRRNQTA